MFNKIVAYITLAVAFVILGIFVADIHAQQSWQDDIAETINRCEEDGLEDCHVEYIMDGLFIDHYEVVGKGEANEE